MDYILEKSPSQTDSRLFAIKNQIGEKVGQIIKYSSKIAFSKEQAVFSLEETERAVLTLEIGWPNHDGATVVFHDRENKKDLAFYQHPSSKYLLHILADESEFPIEIIQKKANGKVIIYFHNQESAILTEDDQLVQFHFIDDNTNVPDSFFFLSWFMIQIFRESY
ncbi:hypothetical protein MFLO_00190 [Listeria floridensis FSL S10-1187]|uniref:Uncharacterized protein n=1 Tax=Listeria floridensis FSL S10-1187 TaxID=1265817 RepID=A0ABN0RI64_9LIST|nr:hypothetical protein [Listeria floridensis]EUJ33626.1 hypothetical protein MFLO_00190 [Listeria floridensis FSL S10-1187]